MTGPKPILANAKIQLSYVSSEPLTHKCNLNVDAAFTGGNWLVTDAAGGTQNWTTCVDQFWALMKPLYSASAAFGLATLFTYSSGIYIPVATHTPVTAVGTGSASLLANQLTLTARDDLYNLDRIQLMGTNTPQPFFEVANLAGGTFGTIIADLENKTAGHVGNWYRSKDNQYINNMLNIVSTVNKKSRRRLGLV